MNNTQHTPGPWEYSFDHRAISGLADSVSGQTLIADVDGLGRPGLVIHANGHHIVACVNACEGINPKAVPELLGALQTLAEWVQAKADADEIVGLSAMSVELSPQMDAARAAIAKATTVCENSHD